MRRSQHTRILHMALQIPKLLQPDAADVDDIRGRDNRGLRVGARQARAHGHDEVEEVLVEGEQTEQSLRDGGRLVRLGLGLGRHGRVVRGHVLAVQVLDLEDVDGDAAAVSSAGPLGVLAG